jgi:hypothetical protein
MTRSWHSSFVLAAAAAALIGAAPARAAEKKVEPLALTMSHYMATAESDVIARMRVPPDERSRELVVEWVADDLSGGSHTITLDGARAAASHQYAIKRLMPGAYVVTAILRRNDGSEVKRAANVSVFGVNGAGPLTDGAGEQPTRGGWRPAGRR